MPEPAPQRHPLLLPTVLSGTFLVATNFSIINVGLPAITRAFDATLLETQLIVVAFVGVTTALLIPMGGLGDVLGRRTAYLGGFAAFAAAALAAGLSANLAQLVAFRATQAIGAALLIASGPAALADAYPGARGRALGALAVAVSLGLTSGNVLGGLILEFASWRWLFLVNVPVALLGLALAYRAIPAATTGPQRRVDRVGSALLASSLLALLAGISLPAPYDDARLRAGLIALGAVLMADFLAWERRAARPLLRPGLLRNRFLLLGLGSVLCAFIALSTSLFLMPFYLEQVLGLRPSIMGLVLLASVIGLSLLGPVSGHLHDRRRARGVSTRLLAPSGLVLGAAGFAVLSTLGIQASPWLVGGELLLVGLGMGIFAAPNNAAILEAVTPPDYGAISGVLATMRNLGTSIGVPFTAWLFVRLNPAGIRAPADRFVDAMDTVFIAAAGLMLLAALMSAARAAGPVTSTVDRP